MEIIANAVQTVQANQNVLFTDAVVGCSNSLLHRVGSGLVTLKGNTSTQCRARYKAHFSGNIAIAAVEQQAQFLQLLLSMEKGQLLLL